MDWVIDIIKTSVVTAFGWFDTIMSSTGAWPLMFGAFGVVCSYRFILRPLLGGSLGSDRASKRGSSQSDSGSWDVPYTLPVDGYIEMR